VIPRLDTSALTIHELNALLKEIEERMARLSPHLLRSAQAADPPATVVPIRPERVPASTPEPSAFDLTPYLTPESSLTPRGITVDPAPVPANPPSPFPLRADSFGYRGEDQPVARHSYFESKTPVEAQLEGLGELLVPAVVPEPRPELVLSEPVLQFARPAGPPPVPPETLRLKMYVLIAALAGVVLIAAPLTGMMVYRQLHPMYIYHLPEPAPAAAPAPAAETAPSPAAPVAKPRSKSGSAAHKRQQAKRQPPRVAVWPPQPHY
jgi:hypothetical protein